MKLFVLVALCFVGCLGVRDAAFWSKLIYGLSRRAKPAIVSQIAASFNQFIQTFDLSNDRRISHFLGQCSIESAYFTTTTEFASGVAYNRRRDLGNLQPGDGPRFKVRNYFVCISFPHTYYSLGSWVDSAHRTKQLWPCWSVGGARSHISPGDGCNISTRTHRLWFGQKKKKNCFQKKKKKNKKKKGLCFNVIFIYYLLLVLFFVMILVIYYIYNYFLKKKKQ
jgi:hypothetical protein